jgi:TonB family protein
MTAEGQSKGWKGTTRRTVPRFVVQAPLDVTVLRSGIPDTVPGRSVNLGERGIAAMLAGELMPGETVGVEVRLPHGDPFRTRAMVRYQDKLRCGLEFVGLSAEQRASIRDWAKDAKALDPEVHLSAVAGIAQVVESALESRQKIAGDKPENAAERSRENVTAKPTVKWGIKAPEPETADNTPEHKDKKTVSDGRRSSSRPGSAQPKKRRGMGWIIFLVVAAIALAVFWWRWNRGWQELESGLKTAQAAATEKPQAQVPAEVMEKLLVHRVEPKYPPEARQAKLEGIIALDIVVGRDGSVVSTHALNGPEVLARAATDALRWWKFEPYRVNGEPAVVETTVAVEFKR